MAQTANLFTQLRGAVIPAMATPLDLSGYRVNTDGVPQLVDFLIDRGVGGLFVGGTTGEGVVLSGAERMRLHAATVQATAGRVPVLIHAGTNTTRETFDLALHAAEIGADALVVITPTFYPLGDEALFNYFATIAASVPALPLLVYDIPHFANNGISPALLARLAADIPSFAGVKCSRPDAQMIRKLIDATPDGKLLLAGNEQIMLGSLAMGAHGMISGLATAVPEPFVGMAGAFNAGRLAEAHAWFTLSNQILDIAARGPRIGNIKAILEARGVPVGPPVPPRPVGNAGLWQEILALLDSVAA